MNICENCKIEHDGNYGSGRFCGQYCARGFSTKKDRIKINEKIRKVLKGHTFEYVCETCNTVFIKKQKIKKKINCDACKRKVIHYKENICTFYDISTRTVAKILKRANIKCMMCNWDRTTLDIHHIIPKKQGGTNNDNNLICLCPNCHRLAHENKYSIDELENNSVEKLFNNWREYYYPGDGPGAK